MLTWLLRAGSYTILLRVFAVFVTLSFVSVMSQWMDKGDYGWLAILLSITNLAAAIGGFGQSELMVRELPSLLAEKQVDQAKEQLVSASRRVFLISLPIGLLAGGYFVITGAGLMMGTAGFMISVLLSFSLAWSGAARSHGMYLWALGPKDIFWRLGMLFLAWLALMTGFIKVDLVFVAFSAVAVLLTAVGLQARKLGLRLRDFARFPAQGEHDFHTGKDLMLSVASNTAQSTLDVILIGAFISALAAAEYFPANRIALLAGFFSLPFQLVVGPRLSRMLRTGDTSGAKRLATLATAMVSFASLAVAVFLIIGFDFYASAFETATAETRHYIVILVSGQVLMALMGFPGIVLIATGEQKLLARQGLTFFVLGCLTVYAAALSGSVTLVAWAAMLSVVGQKLAMTLATIRKTGIWPLHCSAIRRSDTDEDFT